MLELVWELWWREETVRISLTRRNRCAIRVLLMSSVLSRLVLLWGSFMMLGKIEKRKHVEEAVHNMQSQWQTLREKLGHAGLVLLTNLTAVENSQSDVSPTADICQQIHLAHFVSESIGRGVARAEVEAEMEAQLEAKNFDIARLCDKLHYYECMNREMSQRNQEAVEVARCDRQKRRRRQKWVWGSIATAITLGSAALAWSYLPSGEGLYSTIYPEATEPNSDIQ